MFTCKPQDDTNTQGNLFGSRALIVTLFTCTKFNFCTCKENSIKDPVQSSQIIAFTKGTKVQTRCCHWLFVKVFQFLCVCCALIEVLIYGILHLNPVLSKCWPPITNSPAFSQVLAFGLDLAQSMNWVYASTSSLHPPGKECLSFL